LFTRGRAAPKKLGTKGEEGKKRGSPFKLFAITPPKASVGNGLLGQRSLQKK